MVRSNAINTYVSLSGTRKISAMPEPSPSAHILGAICSPAVVRGGPVACYSKCP